MSTQPLSNEPENDLDHNSEDAITKLLVGFANDLLAYEDRMERVNSPILFIHQFVEKRRKKFDALIATATTQARLSALRRVKQRLPDPNNNVEEWKGHNLGLSQALAVVDLEIDELGATLKATLEGDT